MNSNFSNMKAKFGSFVKLGLGGGLSDEIQIISD
jgi:hypothetical protein